MAICRVHLYGVRITVTVLRKDPGLVAAWQSPRSWRPRGREPYAGRPGQAGSVHDAAMRTLVRRRHPARRSQLSVVAALDDDGVVEPGDVVMLEDLGACLVLSVDVPDDLPQELLRGERAVALEVEALALENEAPDLG